MYFASNSIMCTKELLDSLKDKTASVINSYSISNDDDTVQFLMQDFENAQNMFSEVDTPYKMYNFFF